MALQLVRFPDWDQRLVAAVALAETRRWRWGQHDCVALAVRLVEATTGERVISPHWRSRRAMVEALHEAGGLGGLAAAAAGVLGPELPWQRARRGDVVLVRVGGMASLAVSVGAQVVGADRIGVEYWPLSAGACCWGIG